MTVFQKCDGTGKRPEVPHHADGTGQCPECGQAIALQEGQIRQHFVIGQR